MYNVLSMPSIAIISYNGIKKFLWALIPPYTLRHSYGLDEITTMTILMPEEIKTKDSRETERDKKWDILENSLYPLLVVVAISVFRQQMIVNEMFKEDQEITVTCWYQRISDT